MRKRAFLFSAILIAMCLTPASAADVGGKWKATMETPMGAMEINFTFQVDGEKLTGTISGMMGGEDQKISEGAVKGDDISFAVAMSSPMGDMKIGYKGKVAGDEMKLTMSFGDMGSQELTAKRVKP